MAERSTERLWNKAYIMVLVLGIFTSTSSQMVTPLISKYAISLGAPLTFAATIASIMSLAALFCRPFSGAISDIFNRKTLMIISTVITGVCMLGYALADNITTVVIVRIIHGISFSFMGVANMAFSSSFIPRERMGEGMSYIGLGTILSSALGPNIGMSLSDKFGYEICFIASAAISIISVVLMFLIPYKRPENEEPANLSRLKQIRLKNLIATEIIVYAAIMGLFSCGNGLLNTFIALIGDERGVANIGLFFTAYSIVVIFIRMFTGRILDKRGLAIILIPSFFIAAAGMVLVGIGTATWMFIIAGGLKALGQGAGSPSVQASCIKTLGRERAGVASSTCYIGQDIGNSIAPIVGGMVASSWGYDTLFYLYAGLLVVGGMGLYMLQLYLEKRRATRNAK